MKILMVSSEFPPVVGGIASHVHELSKALVQKGHQLTVVSRLPKNTPANEILDGIQVCRPRLTGNRWVYAWQLRRYLKRLLKQEQYDLIHVHGIRPLKSLRNINKPICFTNHSSGFLKRLLASSHRQRKTLQDLNLCDYILSPSKELDQATLTMGYKGSHLYIPNGVDTKKFTPGENTIKQQLKIPETAFCFILSRRLVEKNGVLFFAEAFAGIDNDNVYAIVAGDGVLREQFEAILQQADVMSRVRMLGYVPNHEMIELYQAADVAVLPSLMEATSISGLEAMACGLPVVGTRVGGIPELVTEGENGLLVPAANVSALREAMLSAVENPSSLQTMSVNNRTKVSRSYSWQSIADQVLSVYQQLV